MSCIYSDQFQSHNYGWYERSRGPASGREVWQGKEVFLFLFYIQFIVFWGRALCKTMRTLLPSTLWLSIRLWCLSPLVHYGRVRACVSGGGYVFALCVSFLLSSSFFSSPRVLWGRQRCLWIFVCHVRIWTVVSSPFACWVVFLYSLLPSTSLSWAHFSVLCTSGSRTKSDTLIHPLLCMQGTSVSLLCLSCASVFVTRCVQFIAA